MPIVDPYQGELFDPTRYESPTNTGTANTTNVFTTYTPGSMSVEEEIVTEHVYDEAGRCVKTTRKVLKHRTPEPYKYRSPHTPYWTTPYTPQYSQSNWQWNPNQVTC